MSQEAKTVRPFTGLESTQGLFDEASVYFGLDRCPANSTIVLPIDPDEYMRRPIVLQWSHENGFEAFLAELRSIPEETGIPPDALSLLVMASTNYLKLTETLLSIDLTESEALGNEVDLTDGRRPAPFMAGHHGSSIDLLVALNRNLTPAPLRPWRKATWLAHCRFGLRTSNGRSMFRPLPLTHKTREELGLDARAMRYFELGDHDLLLPYDDQAETPRFYVDDQILAELSASANTSSSRSMQLQLALDFMAAVIHEAARRGRELDATSYEDLKDSLLGRVIRIAAGPGSRIKDMQNLFSTIRTDPAKAIARAEHTIDLQGASLNVFHENGS